MKKSRKFHKEEKHAKYFKKELSLFQIKSKSPSLTTTADSPKSSGSSKHKKIRQYSEYNGTTKIFVPIIKDDHAPFSIEHKQNEKENSFLSNIEQNHFFTMKLNKNNINIEQPSLFNSDIKPNQQENIQMNNASNFVDKNTDVNENNSPSIFNNTMINTDVYDNFLHSISASSSNSNSSSNIKNNEDKNGNNSTQKHNNENVNFYSLENLTDKEKVIIQALIDLNKDNLYKKEEEEEVNSIDFDFEEYSFNKKYKNIISSYSSEEDLEFEKSAYEFVDSRIKLYYKTFRKSKPHCLEEKKSEIKKFNNVIKKILTYEQKIEKFSCIGFKSIVMSLFSLIIDLLSNNNFKMHLKRMRHKEVHVSPFDNENSNNFVIFIDLICKYNKIKDLCPFIEKDFKEMVENFENEKKMKISLIDLFTDLYWDYAFKMHNINNKFINCFLSSDKIKNISQEEYKHIMNKIVNILCNCDMPYKKNIGELLSLPYMNKENIFLMDYILKYKKKYNLDDISNQNNSNNNDENLKNNMKENGEISSINNNNKEQKEIKDKNTENFSLEEVYNYIQSNDGDEQKSKKKGKKHKRKRKNKNDDEKNKENNKENEKNLNNQNEVCNDDDFNDPIVEEFIEYFKNFNKLNANCVKIKPVISNEWIQSIS